MAFVFERFLVPEYASVGDSLIPQQLKDAVVSFADSVISSPDFFDENGKIMIEQFQLDGQKVLLAMDYMFANEVILKQLSNQLAFGITEDNLIKAQKLAIDFVSLEIGDFGALFANAKASAFAIALKDALSNAEIKKAYNPKVTMKMVASWGTKVIDATIGIKSSRGNAFDSLLEVASEAFGVDDDIAKAITPQRPMIMSVIGLFAIEWIVYSYGLVSQSVEAEVARQNSLGSTDLRGGNSESSATTFDGSSFVKLGLGLGFLVGTYFLLKKQ